MFTPQKTTRSHRRGIVYILALLLLGVLSILAVGMVTMTNTNVRKSENCRLGQAAHMVAESGLAYHMRMMDLCRPTKSGIEMMDQIAEVLAEQLDGTENLDGIAVWHSQGTSSVFVPSISLGQERGSFTAMLNLDTADPNKVWLTVLGRFGNLQRQAKMALLLETDENPTFDFGIATRGAVNMSGQGKILSANDNYYEASILSSFYDALLDTFDMSGQVIVEGNIFTTEDDAGIFIGDKVQVGEPHTGIGNVDFPEPDPTVYEPLAVNLMSNPNPPKAVYTNIRIPANTDPSFAADTVLKGVVYIESPNKVSFAGKVTIQGSIVTDDARDSGYYNLIDFSGQVVSLGSESLPDSPEFAALKAGDGVFLLAPGFETKFSGQFGTLNGAMVADSFQFSGQAGGTIRGVLISYSDASFSYSGQAGIVIDRSGGNGLPSGLKARGYLTPLPNTYEER